MKRFLAWACCLTIASVPVAADDLPKFTFNVKRAKETTDMRRAFTLEITLDAYQKLGKRDAKWDGHVEKGLKALAEFQHGPVWNRAIDEATARQSLTKAIDLGCTDPMVMFMWASVPDRPPDADRKLEFQAALRTLVASEYPDFLKAQGWMHCSFEWLESNPNDENDQPDLAKSEASLKELVKILAKLAPDCKPQHRDALHDLSRQVHECGRVHGGRKKWFDKLESEVLAKMKKDDPIVLSVTGGFWLKYAWDGRGTGVAASVTPEGWKMLKERLTEAEAKLTRAHELDPKLSAPATSMLAVCTGLGHDRASLEKWFRRAVEADPTDTKAYEGKLNYLLPKWHGSMEETKAFAKQLMDACQWGSELPLLGLMIYRDIASSTGNVSKYFRNNPGLWREIEPVIEGIRERHTKSTLGASLYLYFSYMARENAKEASEYVKAAEETGTRLTPGIFGGTFFLDEARSWLENELDK